MQTQARTLPGLFPAAGGAGRNRLTNAPKSYPPELYNRPAASGQRPAASGQRPAASGQRPAASGPNCVCANRRPCPDSSRPELTTGRFRARLPRLRPALALLICAFGLFAAAPAEAQQETVSFVSDSYRIREPSLDRLNQAVVLQVVRSGDTSAAAGGIMATVAPGTTSDFDIVASHKQLRFEAGRDTTELTYFIRADRIIEDDETFTVTLTADADSGYRVGSPSTATVTIIDGTLVASFARNAYTVTEGGNAEVTANLSLRVDSPVPLQVSVADATATHGSDYSGPRTINVTIPAGDTSATFSIPITDDSEAEQPETFTVTLQPAPDNFSYLLRAPSVATITINDNDVGTPTTPRTPPNTGGSGSGSGSGGGGGGGGGSSTPALSGDAALGSLAVTATGESGDGEDGAAALALSPAFTPGTTAYTLDVPYETGALAITPAARDDDATARIAGQTLTAGQAYTAHLRPGETTVIEITVTAENDRTTRTYTLRITRAAPDTDPTLPALVVTGNDKSTVNLSPVFTPDNTDYNAALSRGIDTLTVIPVLGDARKSVTVNNVPVTGPAGVTLPGTTPVVTIAVTAEDGVNTLHYTIALQRAGLPANVSRSDLAAMALSLADATTRSIARRLDNRQAASTGPGLTARLRSLFPDTVVKPTSFDPVFETARVDNGRERSQRLPGLNSLLQLADAAWSFDKDNPDAPGLWFEGSTLVGNRMDSAHAGFDAVTGNNFTAGAALSWHQASFNNNNDTALAGINPYLRWTGDSATLDVASGLSKGHFRHKDNGNRSREPVEHHYLSASFAGHLLQGDNLEIALRSEMTRAQLAVGPVTARAGRLRLAVESAATLSLPGDSTLVPSLSVGARRDHGDLAGAGVESGAGLAWHRDNLSLSARTRLFRTALDTEWGIGAALDYRHPGGTFVTLSPSYGNAQDSVGQLWDGGLPRADNLQADGYAPHTPRKQLKADLRAGFTWQAPHRAGLFEPFVEARLQRRPSLRLGAHWTTPGGLTLRLAAERTGGDAGLPADNALLLEASWRPGR